MSFLLSGGSGQEPHATGTHQRDGGNDLPDEAWRVAGQLAVDCWPQSKRAKKCSPLHVAARQLRLSRCFPDYIPQKQLLFFYLQYSVLSNHAFEPNSSLRCINTQRFECFAAIRRWRQQARHCALYFPASGVSDFLGRGSFCRGPETQRPRDPETQRPRPPDPRPQTPDPSGSCVPRTQKSDHRTRRLKVGQRTYAGMFCCFLEPQNGVEPLFFVSTKPLSKGYQVKKDGPMYHFGLRCVGVSLFCRQRSLPFFWRGEGLYKRAAHATGSDRLPNRFG